MSALPEPGPWFVYLVRCADGSLYAGITTDINRRVAEHNSGGGLGARYTRGRGPVTLAYRAGGQPVGGRAARTRSQELMSRAGSLR
jgi:putative endonuclease